MRAQEKVEMVQVILRGSPWSDAEQKAIVDYCEGDVIALGKLLPVMLPRIDLPRALLRGRYMAAASAMEHAGIPIDVSLWRRLVAQWENIKRGLTTTDAAAAYGVFENGVFKYHLFEKFLARMASRGDGCRRERWIYPTTPFVLPPKPTRSLHPFVS
jgi:DNA polymerase I